MYDAPSLLPPADMCWGHASCPYRQGDPEGRAHTLDENFLSTIQKGPGGKVGDKKSTPAGNLAEAKAANGITGSSGLKRY